MIVTAGAKVVQPGADAAGIAQAHGPLPVEAMLGAAIWKSFRITLDYQAHTLTLEHPGGPPPPGVAVPLAENPGTGLITAMATVDGVTAPIVVDAGGGYTWLRGSTVRGWIVHHPDWYRATGAPGQSNQAMVPFALEQQGTAARIGSMQLGPLQLRDVGVLGSGPADGALPGRLLSHLFWSLWSKGAPDGGPVLGWLGGNVLRQYRLTMARLDSTACCHCCAERLRCRPI